MTHVRERERDEERQVHRTDCKVLVLGYVFRHRRSDSTVLRMTEEQYACENWTVKLKEELCGSNKQQECNWREITQIVKDRCNGTQRQNIIAKI
jgi:hypothetical protein